MKEEVLKLNIPNVNIDFAVQKLSNLYYYAFNENISFKSIPTPILWGPAGIGKSEGVYQIAENLQNQLKINVKVTDVRLLLYSPIDLRGVPVADNEKKFTNWLMPKVFDMETENCLNILFLDELSAAPQSVQAAAYQICLDRKIGEFRLPENCIVIAAGNRTTDKSVSYKMPKALCNRLMHFDIKADYNSWRAWAVKNNVSPKVIAYLGFDNSRLCVEPETSDLAYATPRSWSFVSTLLKTVGDTPSENYELIASCVGNDTAIEFISFCKGYADMPLISTVLKGKCSVIPKSFDIMFAMVSSLVSAVKNSYDEITVDELNNVCEYVLKFPKDFCKLFMNDIVLVPELNRKLMKCQGFQQWINKGN